MDKRVKRIRNNNFTLDPTQFLKDNRSNIEKYRYVLEHYEMLGLEPIYETDSNETYLLVHFECPGVYCTHSFKATKKEIFIAGDKRQGIEDKYVYKNYIELIR